MIQLYQQLQGILKGKSTLWRNFKTSNLHFRARKVIKDEEGALHNDKGTNTQEDTTVFNAHVPANTASKYRRQKLTEL